VIVLEDLGADEGTSTKALVYGANPSRAEEALIEHAALIGRLHSLTVGGYHDYMRIRNTLGPLREFAGLFGDPWPTALLQPVPAAEVDRVVQAYRASCAAVGLGPPAHVDGEIATITTLVEENPGRFLALCQGDQNGPGGALRRGRQQRLFDFDCSHFRHALLEGVPARTTWGCIMHIPAHLGTQMEKMYRGEFVKGCLEVADDRLFCQALAAAAARWHVFQVLHRLPACLAQDAPRGPTTRRQQYLAWMDAFAALAEETGSMTALGTSARAMAAQLRTQWPQDTHILPSYPAFRGEPR
jgi:hypothetical protein